MAEETHLTSNLSGAYLSTANTNRDGSGTPGTTIISVFSTTSTNGSLVKSIFIKAGSTTTQGMIRLFVDNGSGTRCMFAEIEVPGITPSGIDPTFERLLDLDLQISSGSSIWATTEKSEGFYIVVNGYDISYYKAIVRTDKTQYTSLTGINSVSTANSNRDGTGTVSTVLTAHTSAYGYNGCRINSITIKAMQSTTKGMVRIYVEDTGTSTALLTEIPIAETNYSSKMQSFEHTIYFDNFSIPPGYKIRASTQNGESFGITIDAEEWAYET